MAYVDGPSIEQLFIFGANVELEVLDSDDDEDTAPPLPPPPEVVVEMKDCAAMIAKIIELMLSHSLRPYFLTAAVSLH